MKLKKAFILLVIIVMSISFYADNSFATSSEIKNIMKVHRQGSYILVINYETHDKWTDNLFFKAHCRFEEGEFTFTSASLNNICEGWHKTEIAISEVMKKRYGYLKEYKIELYCKGILIDSKSGY